MGRSKSEDDMRPGDLVRVTWADIAQCDGGDPKDARLATWETVGWFVRRGMDETIETIVLRGSRIAGEKDGEPDPQSGWMAIPVSLIRKIEGLRVQGLYARRRG